MTARFRAAGLSSMPVVWLSSAWRSLPVCAGASYSLSEAPCRGAPNAPDAPATSGRQRDRRCRCLYPRCSCTRTWWGRRGTANVDSTQSARPPTAPGGCQRVGENWNVDFSLTPAQGWPARHSLIIHHATQLSCCHSLFAAAGERLARSASGVHSIEAEILYCTDTLAPND